jgi:hypothetical protein
MSSPTLTARTTSIPLYQGDDLDKIESLRMDLARAKASASGNARVGDTDADVKAATAALQAACDDAEPRAVVVVVKALGRRQWRSLVEAHPARDGNKDDEQFGVNSADFPDALLIASLSEPTFPTPADRDDFLDSLSDADFTRLWRAAFLLNRVSADDPKDLLAYEQIRASDETQN